MKPFEIHGNLKVKTKDLSIEFLAALRQGDRGGGAREMYMGPYKGDVGPSRAI